MITPEKLEEMRVSAKEGQTLPFLELFDTVEALWKENEGLKAKLNGGWVDFKETKARLEKLEAVARAAEEVSLYFPVRGSAYDAEMVVIKKIHPSTATRFLDALAALKP